MKINGLFWFVAFALGFLAGLSGYGVFAHRLPEYDARLVPANTVWVTDDGFLPKERTISQGTVITFVNKRKTRRIWPASNPHPLHTIYPAFDPKRPLNIGETWQFTFETPGVWRYHDHLFPSFTGRMLVLDAKTGKVPRINCFSPEVKKDKHLEEQCWDEMLTSAYESGGVKEAFRVFTTLYRTDPAFASSGCHKHAHGIGDIFYYEYKKTNGDIATLDFPEETVYCGYGFYHGLFEHMFRDRPDPQLAIRLCNVLDKKLSSRIPRIRLNCFHGIGHGFVQEPEPNVWGNPQAIVDPALSVCDKISPSEYEVRECLQGSFNVISDWTWRQEYKLEPESPDPMAFCKRQTSRTHSLACYYEFSMHLEVFTGSDLVAIAKRYVDSIDDDLIAGMVINSAAAGIMQRAVVENDHTRFIRECYRLAPRLRTECISGISGGFVAHGEPGKEYVKALAFCASPLLTSYDQDFCYKNIFRTFRGAYPKEKVLDICKFVDDKYKKYCDYGQYNQL